MKKSKLGIILLAGATFFGSMTYTGKANAIQKDKKLHLEAGLAIGGLSYFAGPFLEESIFGKSRIPGCIWSIGMASLAGAGKEIVYDKWMGKGTPDPKDFYFTLAGGIISGVGLNFLERILEISSDKVKSINLEINPKNKDFYFSYNFSFE